MLDTLQQVEQLLVEIKRLGKQIDGKTTVKFGLLVRDDIVNNTFEALAQTLKSAKKLKKIQYNSEILLQGAHDDIDIVIV
jgi:hypothetical protein